MLISNNTKTKLSIKKFSRCFSTTIIPQSFKQSQKVNNSITGTILKTLKKIFPTIKVNAVNGIWTVNVSSHDAKLFFKFLKRNTFTQYAQLQDITAIDYQLQKLRFEVVYQFLSVKYNSRLIVSVSVAEAFSLDTATSIYPSANWYEREIWDRYGIFFSNHPDLRRRLTDYGFNGHPQRKDFPVTGFFEVQYNDFYKRVLYQDISLPQEYRVFSLNNSW